MEPPTIAAIVPVFERPTVAREALESIVAQSRPPERIVVIDDGSTDDTAERLVAWMRRAAPAAPAHVVTQEHAGPAAARNRGAREADGCALLAFLDSDDLWPRDYLERMASALARDPGAVAATADLRLCHPDPDRDAVHRRVWVAGRATARMLHFGSPGTPNTVLRARAFHEIGGYDTSLGFAEDQHLLIRMSTLGRWLHVPGEPVRVRVDHARRVGERDHFGLTHPDLRRIQARMLERFLVEEGGAGHVPRRLWRRELSVWWYKAGRHLVRLDRRREAHACFRKALAWRRSSLKAWWRAAVTWSAS